jgi:hypothetical protein
MVLPRTVWLLIRYIVAKAMLDGKDGKPEMSDEIARSYIMLFMQKREAQLMEQQAERDRVTYKDYLLRMKLFLQKTKKEAVFQLHQAAFSMKS